MKIVKGFVVAFLLVGLVFPASAAYKNSNGVIVQSPAHTSAAPVGATAHCKDGTWSFSLHHQGSCSHHGGVSVFLK